MLRFRVSFPKIALVLIAALATVGCGNAEDDREPGYATNEEYGYVATVWANIVDDVDDVPYGGGWELVLNVDSEFAAQTTGVRVTWPDGVTTTDLDPDFRERPHPLGSIFLSTANSRFVKYGTGQGWPRKGPYLFQVTFTPPPDATHWGVSLNDAYGSKLLSNPTDQRIEDRRVIAVFQGINELGVGTHVGIAMTNDQNIRGAGFALPKQP